MFIQTWNKYLPVIRILLKRSVNAAQTLDMDKTDFERAAGGKKIKFVFSIVVINGRIQGTAKVSPVAKDLISVLQQDDVVYKFLRSNELEFTMNSNFQLLINNTAPAAEPPRADDTPALGEAEPGALPTE